MNESMKKYMKTGLIHFMAFPSVMKGEGPILETLAKIAGDDYFDAVEISWIKDDAVRAAAKKMLDSSGITVVYGASPALLTTGRNINDTDEAKRREAVEDLKAGIDEADEMGAKGISYLSGKYEEATKEQSYRALVQSTWELCEYAAPKGIIVELEVFDYDVDKCSLIGPVTLAKRFAEEIRAKHANFGLIVDLSHLPLIRETAEEAILPVKEYITHAHIGNAVVIPGLDAYGDMHPRFGFPNSANDVPELAEFLKILWDIGFLNAENPPVVSFEVKPWGDEDSDMVIANAKRTLNAAWAQL